MNTVTPSSAASTPGDNASEKMNGRIRIMISFLMILSFLLKNLFKNYHTTLKKCRNLLIWYLLLWEQALLDESKGESKGTGTLTQKRTGQCTCPLDSPA
jgi:hypothetical protein